MKKALIVATVGGFLSQFEMNDVKILQENGYEVHYAANFNNNMYQVDFEELQKKQIIVHGVDIDREPLKIQVHWKVYRTLKKMIEELQIDLVHCHTPVGGALARLAAHFAKREVYVIYTAHGFHFYKGAPLKNWIYYPAEKIMAKMTDCLITINKEDLEYAEKFCYKKNGEAVQVPGVGVNVTRFYPRPELKKAVRRELQIPENAFHIVTIGEMNANKNLETAVRALTYLEKSCVYYSIWGCGKEEREIKNLISKLRLEKRVKCFGYCEKPEIVLQSADMFLFPSIREGLGMAALEALACGIPVVARNNRGTREYMQNGINGMVCNKNTAEEFAKKIKEIYEIYQTGNLEDTFKDACINSTKPFKLCETEKVMRRVYECAEQR